MGDILDLPYGTDSKTYPIWPIKPGHQSTCVVRRIGAAVPKAPVWVTVPIVVHFDSTSNSWKNELVTFMVKLWHGQRFRISDIYVGIPPVTSGFPSPIPSIVDIWCFFVVSLNKMLNTQLVVGDLWSYASSL